MFFCFECLALSLLPCVLAMAEAVMARHSNADNMKEGIIFILHYTRWSSACFRSCISASGSSSPMYNLTRFGG